MKKILSFICFSISFLALNAQTHGVLKDTLSIKSNEEITGYRSKTPILKIPTDSNIHYHMQHKKMDVNSSVPMSNSFNYGLPLESNSNPKIKKFYVRSLFKHELLQDSVVHDQGLPLNCINDKYK